MSIELSKIAGFMEEFAPPGLAEEWDNVGLLIGSMKRKVDRILVCLDVTSRVAEEAVNKKADLIISHHPLIFKALKSVSEDDFKGAIIHKLIRNDICLYSAHTNLDTADGGINDILASVLELQDICSLKSHREEKVYKVVVFVPEDKADEVRGKMAEAGAGWIGNYSGCFFITEGTGTFRPLDNTNPYIGRRGRLEKVREARLETVVGRKALTAVIEAMVSAHPYEEPAYDVFPLSIKGRETGLGKVGFLKLPMDVLSFADLVKNKLNIKDVRLIGQDNRIVRKAAVFCGSFDGSWSDVKSKEADVLVTGDIKYHDAQDAREMGICVIDAGHFATERIIVPRLVKLLRDRFKEIEIAGSDLEDDPFNTY